MFRIRRSVRACIFLMLAPFLMAGCSDIATKSIETERVQLHREPLAMSAKGQPDVSLDATGAVTIGSHTLTLTDAQKKATRHYRTAVIALADFTLDRTSQMTRHVVIRALFATVTGREETLERKIDEQAEAMTHSPAFCSQLDTVRQRQEHMVEAVAALEPYVHLNRQDVEDCLAGHPYKARL
ncbi:MAG TPA: hypothetical protein VFL78_02355 [Rhodanobacteraceae bacterium]|nr:hypothetical protein [Rhodanobacteraceae bacterium]